MGRLKFTPLARSDLRDIRDYIAQDNPEAAVRYIHILKQKCELLAENPGMGTKREEYLGLYKFPVGNYLIFYRPRDIGIEVIRILHGARDVDATLFFDDPRHRDP